MVPSNSVFIGSCDIKNMDRWIVVITTSVENLDGLWLHCYTCCMLSRTP